MVELKRNSRIQAFTLLESVVAITILSVLIGLGSATYSNILASEDPIVYHQAIMEVDRCFHRLENDELELETRYFDFDQFGIKQEVNSYESRLENGLYRINYTVFDQFSNELYRANFLMVK